eukprot:398454-Hanusia_phi.AAC.1
MEMDREAGRRREQWERREGSPQVRVGGERDQHGREQMGTRGKLHVGHQRRIVSHLDRVDQSDELLAGDIEGLQQPVGSDSRVGHVDETMAAAEMLQAEDVVIPLATTHVS